jgi:hypothetical protein
VDRVDDLGPVDAIEVDRRHAEVDVAELALDDLYMKPGGSLCA